MSRIRPKPPNPSKIGDHETDEPPSRESTRLVAVSRVYNEEDVIEAFVRHHAPMVTHHIILDNGSVDRTIPILRLLAREGYPLTVLENRSVSFSQEEHNTMLYRLAADEHNAAWVVFLDADEFIFPTPASVRLRQEHQGFPGDHFTAFGQKHGVGAMERLLRKQLEALPPEAVCGRIQMVNFAATQADDQSDVLAPRRIVYRDDEPLNVYKCFVRGGIDAGSIKIEAGNHAVRYRGRLREGPLLLELMLAHYHTRAPLRRLVGALIGSLKVVAAGGAELERGRSGHYASFLEKMMRNPRLLLDDDDFMLNRNLGRDLVREPIEYYGLPLRYTTANDGISWALHIMCGYVEALARSHGEILDADPSLRAQVAARSQLVTMLIETMDAGD
ncbi:glycosyltransferase family 2 protein [Lichenicoccus roseus]|uniref:Glycosyltransferase family 2 protein n=1 Tax=Lichenicoccus roseus TaxID=2683649 RepID=A0A5R9IYL4_9PROT|nr:glycosyltransferase family 2 protein [Lichenicoccus roseus]TLU70565.1 glycosyltransferase family 2 protein [Lichenicoccus roseus]